MATPGSGTDEVVVGCGTVVAGKVGSGTDIGARPDAVVSTGRIAGNVGSGIDVDCPIVVVGAEYPVVSGAASGLALSGVVVVSGDTTT